MLALTASGVVCGLSDIIKRRAFNVIRIDLPESPFVPNRGMEDHDIQVIFPAGLTSLAFGAVLLKVLE